jgi:hypothetical protein
MHAEGAFLRTLHYRMYVHVQGAPLLQWLLVHNTRASSVERSLKCLRSE